MFVGSIVRFNHYLPLSLLWWLMTCPQLQLQPTSLSLQLVWCSIALMISGNGHHTSLLPRYCRPPFGSLVMHCMAVYLLISPLKPYPGSSTRWWEMLNAHMQGLQNVFSMPQRLCCSRVYATQWYIYLAWGLAKPSYCWLISASLTQKQEFYHYRTDEMGTAKTE